MKQLPIPARLFVGSTVTIGTIWLLRFSGLPPFEQLPGFLALCAAAALTSAFKLQLPTTKNRAELSPAFVVNFTSLLLFGPAPTLLTATLGEVTRSVVGVHRRNPAYRALFRIACLVIAVRAAGFSYALLGGSSGHYAPPPGAMPLAAAFLTYFLVSSGITALDMAFTTREALVRVWLQSFAWSGPTYFIGASVAAVLVEVVDHRLWVLVALGTVPAFLTYRAYGVYAGRVKESGDRAAIESPQGMAVINREGRVVVWDDALEGIFGCSPEDALGRPLLEAVPMLANTMVPQVISTVLASGEGSILEHVAVRGESGRRILEFRVLHFESGVSVFWHDVTDQVGAEDALMHSEERYASALVTIGYLAAPDANAGLWDWDIAHDRLFFSARWKSMLGLRADTAMSRPEDWFERVHPEDRGALAAALEAHMAGETAHVQHEHRIRHESGAYRWMLCRGVAVRRATGRATRISGSQTDITERASAQEQRHREVIKSLNEGIAVINHDGGVAVWNDALERIVGYSRDEVLGRPLVEAVPLLSGTTVPEVIACVLATGVPSTIEQLTLDRESGRRILQVRVLPFAGGVTVFWQDVTDRVEAEDALRRSEQRYALAASGANDGLWDWDLERDEIYFSPRWKAMVGMAREAPCSRPKDWFKRVHPSDHGSLQAALEAHMAGETAHFQHEHRIRHEDGTYRWMLCRGVAVRQADGRATRIAGSQTDITERVSAQEQLRHDALHDTLTALPNRALFMELLARVIDRRARHPEDLFAVLFLDIDRFKVINDSLGHLVGDELLVGISRRLETYLRQGDVLARLGGDEFTILLNDLTDRSEASVIAQRLQDVLRDPFFVAGREIFVTASVGVALSAPDYTQAEDIMRDADTAMYRAKALGKARHELFDVAMHAKAVARLGFEHDLRAAIEHNEFAVHYQPIVSLASLQWTGFEALLRWDRAGREVTPAEFIPVAEEMGIIEPLGTWVLQQACRQAAAWRKQFQGGSFAGITVNVSTRQLMCPDFLHIVQSALQASSLKPGDLRLEVTESVLMDDPERAEIVLRDLRRFGVKIYLDDFGTGFSSLSYLHRFPVDSLKIDRSFVASLKEGSERPAIIESIVTLAKTLGTHVIAEGVETERQVHELARLGCTEAQGFFFARALPAATAETLLANQFWTGESASIDPATANHPWAETTKHQAA